MKDNVILSTRNLKKFYPGVKAINDVSISFYEGEVHAIVGENGAGKSTLIKMIAGAVEPTSGAIELYGKEYKHLNPQEAKQLGIEVIYQEFNLIEGMSCAENVYLNEKTTKSFIVNGKKRSRMAKELFNSLGVDIDPDRKVGSYTPAYMQIVEIAKAVSKNVKILIMDEPTAPLTVAEVEMLFNIIDDLKNKGITVIYISHRLEEIFRIADRVSVFRDGEYVSTSSINNTNRHDLISKMVGREITENYPARNVVIGEETIRAENVTGNGVHDISFFAKRGEILGFAGLVGAGRTELMSLLYGAAKIDSGKLYIKGKPIRLTSPGAAITNGIGLIPEDRKNLGCFLTFDISWNTVITCITNICKYGVVSKLKERQIVEKYVNRLNIKVSGYNQLVQNLSGGNQQKVVLAKTLAAKTEILIFDEPTRGIDVGAKQEIYKLMNELVESGRTILMVSSDMPELLGMADRVIVICEGRQTGVVEKEDFDQKYILDLASGNN